ncbi:MAG: NAD(P)H-hydrate dehydratase [Candidatus Electryonea clarkiae]|nr:NAD(P)H-hydrate dehydratase [Candidatus Electryonea clarkiae]MDP8287399.1 NAD(P)H-hydrate dehydratase [Candidatus Electryonea clarkiae]
MRPIVTPDQMRELDRRTIEELGLPGIVLMELAARGVMVEVENILQDKLRGSRGLVFCGPGNNGGDGFAVARRMKNMKMDVTVLLFADRDRIKGDALINMNVYEKSGGEIIEITSTDELADLPVVDVIVDALLGTGLSGAVKGLMADAIKVINDFQAPVVAVDIPSGINGNNGAADGPAVAADITATFGEIKAGHLITPGLEHSGRIVRVDIQIPPEFVEESECALLLAEPEDIRILIPERMRSDHKGDAGKVLLIAGSVGMTGAAELASRACLRIGAGLVKVAIARDAQATLAGRNAEVMTIPVADTEEGTIAPEAETTIREAESWADIEVIGPGLSLNPDSVQWFKEHAENFELPTVIDADGLNALAENKELLKKLSPEIVLTPHIGEFSRLTGMSIEEIENNRIETVKKFASEWNAVIVLKGVPTLIATPDQPLYGVLAGNPGMATAGMGDVLTGVIAGLMAQGLSPVEASLAGVSIHGLGGDLAANDFGATGLVAGDVVERLPLAQDIIAGRAGYPGNEGGCGGNCSCGDGEGGNGDCGYDDGSCGCQ